MYYKHGELGWELVRQLQWLVGGDGNTRIWGCRCVRTSYSPLIFSTKRQWKHANRLVDDENERGVDDLVMIDPSQLLQYIAFVSGASMHLVVVRP